LRGEPGIGKTALLRDVITRAQGTTVLRCRGLEAEADLPFAGLTELCGGWLPAAEVLDDELLVDRERDVVARRVAQHATD
jgi:hypothetical protein